MRIVLLTQGYETIVDDEDFERVSKWRWKILKANGLLYAARTDKKNNTTVLMHRLIAGAPAGKIVDHKNHNGLDNRKENLRITTQGMNRANSRKVRGSSQFKGVYRTRRGTWVAQIKANGIHHYLGSHSSELVAAQAYDKAASKIFGEFARTNL